MRTQTLAAAASAVLLLMAAGGRPPKDVEEDIRRMAQQVADLAGKQQGVMDRVDLVRRRIRLEEAVLRRLAARREATQAGLAEAEAALHRATEREEAVRVYLRKRMRQRYALGVLQEYRVYFAVNSTQDLKTANLYLQALAARDAERLQTLSEIRTEKAAAREKLSSLQADLDAQALEAEREKNTLAGEQARLSGLLGGLERERATAQRALDESLAAAKQMDKYLSDLAFRSRVDLYAKNMATARGRLPMPCPGTVAHGYGDFVHPRFRTRVPHPGLDISAPFGTPVRAVFDGEVEYADWLSGYGYSVILRHPGGFFTVYAHLDRVDVAKGQTVSQGGGVGTVGELPATGTSGLYFELRRGGKAVDPGPWLKGGSHVP